MSALMESLFYNTPCGSFVFWKPTDPAEHGVPLDEGVDQENNGVEYLVVDGQQRIRSIRAVYNDAELDSDDEAEDDTSERTDAEEPRRRVWCINLAREPRFQSLLQNKDSRREYALFVNAVDPTKAYRKSSYRFNLLPLKRLKEWPTWNDVPKEYRDLVQLSGDGTGTSKDACSKAYHGLQTNLEEMKDRKFFVALTNGQPAAMIDVYNRINAGGKRVEIEERAYAKLVSFYPESWIEVTDLFKAVHAPREAKGGDGTSEDLQRDRALERKRERQFGFKLFIRIFLQVCHYHFDYSLGKNAFSFDIARKEGLLKRLGKIEQKTFQWLWAETKDVVTSVRNILLEPLKCDDLRFLPEIRGLEPVFQLLIQFRRLRDPPYKTLLAALSLRLLLADQTGRSVSEMVDRMRKPKLYAFDVIPGFLADADRELEDALAPALDEANSIQDRYVLLLYWLERMRGARDFKYDEQMGPKLAHRKGQELPVGRNGGGDEIAEKQHMVPFSILKEELDETARRSESHYFNNIGNLTYISRRLNHFDGGLGDRMVDLALESKGLGENLQAHFFEDPVRGEDCGFDAYQEILSATYRKSPSAMGEAGLKSKFELMCRLRRAQIFRGFKEWIAELDREACKQMGVASLRTVDARKEPHRIEPEDPRCSEPKLAVLVRRLQLPNDVADVLMSVAGIAKEEGAVKRRDHSDGGSTKIRLTKRKILWLEATKTSVVLVGAGRLAQEHRQEVREKLGLTDLPESDVVLHGHGAADSRAMERLEELARWAGQHEDAIHEGLAVRNGEKKPRSDRPTRTEDEFFAEKWKDYGAAAIDACRQVLRVIEVAGIPGIRRHHDPSGRPTIRLDGTIIGNVMPLRVRGGDAAFVDSVYTKVWESTEEGRVARDSLRRTLRGIPGATEFGEGKQGKRLSIPVTSLLEHQKVLVEALCALARSLGVH